MMHMDDGFNKIKKALCWDVMVITPDFTKPFILQTDASGTALGAVLTQEQGGVEKRGLASLEVGICGQTVRP